MKILVEGCERRMITDVWNGSIGSTHFMEQMVSRKARLFQGDVVVDNFRRAFNGEMAGWLVRGIGYECDLRVLAPAFVGDILKRIVVSVRYRADELGPLHEEAITKGVMQAFRRQIGLGDAPDVQSGSIDAFICETVYLSLTPVPANEWNVEAVFHQVLAGKRDLDAIEMRSSKK
jgi:hypothetical protein